MRHILYPLLASAGLLLSLFLVTAGLDAAGVFSLLGVKRENVLVGLMAIGWIGAVTSWVMAKSVAYWSVRARPFEPADATHRAGDLPALLQRLSTALKLRAPELAVYPSDEPNAFAVGPLRHRALFVVTTGFLERLSPEEAEAVVAQELARVASRDVSTLALLHGMINTYTIFPARMLGFIFGTSLRTFEDDTPSDEVEVGTMAVLEVTLAGLATLVVRQFSRAAERRADRAAAALVGREQLAKALDVISSEGVRRSHREVFIWPFKFGAKVRDRGRLLAYHVSPVLRAAAIRRAA